MRLWVGILSIVSIATASGSAAETVTATASGSSSPTPVVAPSLANGDFLIVRPLDTGHFVTVGDGEDEQTGWTFDFSLDPELPLFGPATQLESAPLELTITPRPTPNTPGPPGITTDQLQVGGVPLGPFPLPPVVTPIIQSLQVDVTETVEIELLDFHTSAEILAQLNGGLLPMVYLDDAVVSFAKLNLAKAPKIPVAPWEALVAGASLLLVVGRKLQQR